MEARQVAEAMVFSDAPVGKPLLSARDWSRLRLVLKPAGLMMGLKQLETAGLIEVFNDTGSVPRVELVLPPGNQLFMAFTTFLIEPWQN
jgi:hypothetical protein